MNVKAIIGSIALGSLLTGCIAPAGKVDLRADSRLMGGDEAVVHFDAPDGWFVASKKADRVVLRASDNFSSLTATATPVLADAARCPQLAREAALSVVSKDKAELTSPQADVVDFSGVFPGTPPGSGDRKVFGRAICRDGAVAVASCSIGVERIDTLGATCRQAIDTLAIEKIGAAPAPAPEAQPVAPAPQVEEQPAAPAPQVEEQPAAPAPQPEEQPAAPAPQPEEQPAAPAPQPEEQPAAPQPETQPES